LYATPEIAKCTTLDCLRQLQPDVIIAAQSKLLDTAPYTIPGVPLGERPSSLLSTVPLIWLTGSDSPVIWIPIYPFRPYDPSLFITQSTLFPTKPTPGIDNINSK
jgi:hypothetical protein